MKAQNFKDKYREYLKSKDWKKKRAAKWRTVKRQSCAFCGSVDGLEVHHLIYRQWYDVKTSDLRLTCRRCHELIHRLIKLGRLKYGGSKTHKSRFLRTQRALRRVGIVWENKLDESARDDTDELLTWYNANASR